MFMHFISSSVELWKYYIPLAIRRLSLELVVTAALKLFGVVGETAAATSEAVIDSVWKSFWVVTAAVDFAHLTFGDDAVLIWVPRVITVEAKMMEAWVEGVTREESGKHLEDEVALDYTSSNSAIISRVLGFASDLEAIVKSSETIGTLIVLSPRLARFALGNSIHDSTFVAVVKDLANGVNLVLRVRLAPPVIVLEVAPATVISQWF